MCPISNALLILCHLHRTYKWLWFLEQSKVVYVVTISTALKRQQKFIIQRIYFLLKHPKLMQMCNSLGDICIRIASGIMSEARINWEFLHVSSWVVKSYMINTEWLKAKLSSSNVTSYCRNFRNNVSQWKELRVLDQYNCVFI